MALRSYEKMHLNAKQFIHLQGAMGTGMGGQSVDDMERVIAAMRRVIERLQGENDALKKQTPKLGVHSEIARENRQLKVSLREVFPGLYQCVRV